MSSNWTIIIKISKDSFVHNGSNKSLTCGELKPYFHTIQYGLTCRVSNINVSTFCNELETSLQSFGSFLPVEDLYPVLVCLLQFRPYHKSPFQHIQRGTRTWYKEAFSNAIKEHADRAVTSVWWCSIIFYLSWLL